MSRDSLRRIIRTFIQAFLGLLLPGLFGWLNELTKWAQDQGQRPFPDAGSLAYLGVAAIGAGAIAVVTLIMTGIEDATGKGFLRTVPARVRGAAGYVTQRTLALPWIVAGAVLLVLALLL